MKKIFTLGILLLGVFGGRALAANNAAELPGWGQSFWQSPNGVQIDTDKNFMRMTTDKSLVCDGNGSLIIEIAEQMDNLNFQAAQNVEGLKPGKSYILTGKFNVPSASWRYRLMFGNEALVNIGNIVKTCGEWSDAEYVFEYKSTSAELRIQSSGSGRLSADNISLREVLFDEAGKVIGYGEELLENGGFEDGLDMTPPGEVTGIVTKNRDSGAEITWKNPRDTDFCAVYVYDVTDGKKLLQKVTDNGISLSGLTNGRTYTYLICTADLSGNISDGVTVEACPVADPVKIGTPELLLDGKPAASVTKGRLSARVSLKNNAMAEDYSAELILVLLKDGALCNIVSDCKIIERTDDGLPYTGLSAELDVPEGEGYGAAVYLWDSITGMEALCDALVTE